MLLRSAFPLIVLAAMTTTTVAFETTAFAQGTAPAGAPKKSDPKAGNGRNAKGTKAATPATPATPPAEAAAPAEAKAAEPTAEAEPKDEGYRAVYLSADIGFVRADVGGLSDNTGMDKTGASGLLAGLGVGYRWHAFRLGGRFRDNSTTEFSLWSVMGELGYGLGLRPLSPVFFVHAGYMFDVGVQRGAIASSLPAGNVLTPDVDLKGAVIGVEATAMYYVSKVLRLGPFIGLDATFLSRSQVATPQSLFPVSDETRANPLYSGGGSGIGYMFNVGLRGTGDIAF